MRFSHAVLYVKDVERSAAFYEKAFGLPTRFIHEEKCYAEMETGSVALAFASYDLADMALPDGVIVHNRSQKPQGVEIAFDTDDVDSALCTCGFLWRPSRHRTYRHAMGTAIGTSKRRRWNLS